MGHANWNSFYHIFLLLQVGDQLGLSHYLFWSVAETELSFAVLSLGVEETLGIEEEREVVGDGDLPNWISEAEINQTQFPSFLHFLVVVYLSFPLDKISLGTFALHTLYI